MKTLTQIKSIAKTTGNSHDQTDVLTTQELDVLSDRTCQGSSGCFEGTVTKVVDGDTLDINNVRIRLALVNTPETYQVGYLQATQLQNQIVESELVSQLMRMTVRRLGVMAE